MFIHCLRTPAKIFYTSLKNFMQAQKFYTGTKKDVVHHYIFFTGSIEVYVRYRADFFGS